MAARTWSNEIHFTLRTAKLRISSILQFPNYATHCVWFGHRLCSPKLVLPSASTFIERNFIRTNGCPFLPTLFLLVKHDHESILIRIAVKITTATKQSRQSARNGGSSARNRRQLRLSPASSEYQPRRPDHVQRNTTGQPLIERSPFLRSTYRRPNSTARAYGRQLSAFSPIATTIRSDVFAFHYVAQLFGQSYYAD